MLYSTMESILDVLVPGQMNRPEAGGGALPDRNRDANLEATRTRTVVLL